MSGLLESVIDFPPFLLLKVKIDSGRRCPRRYNTQRPSGLSGTHAGTKVGPTTIKCHAQEIGQQPEDWDRHMLDAVEHLVLRKATTATMHVIM